MKNIQILTLMLALLAINNFVMTSPLKEVDIVKRDPQDEAEEGKQKKEGKKKGGKGGIGAEGLEESKFCESTGLTPSDGTQNRAGSCSSTPQGAIPAVENMVSSIITSPKNGECLEPKTAFPINVLTINMQLGFFDDPNENYYLQPQTLNQEGLIQGHQHVVIQLIENEGGAPLDPMVFEFFKGLDQQPDAENSLSTEVLDEEAGTEGLAEGEYRLCTITGTVGHQPVIMPVAQRGHQDDCIRFTVGACQL